MFIIRKYSLAVVFCIITMFCWGSWANTQKMAELTWRFELFYWDYVIGIVLLSLLFALTLGSSGREGRAFSKDLKQAKRSSFRDAIIGGIIFNAANILLVAAIAVAGMSVAFPVAIGIALVLGVIVNYIATPKGNPLVLFIGIALITAAIIFDASAYSRLSAETQSVTGLGILLSVSAGILMSFFYRFVARSMSTNFENPESGKFTPYTAVFIFTLGILLSNFIFNTIIMKIPVEGDPVTISQYFDGSFSTHLTGILGGIIWCIGMSFSIIAAGQAGYAISYGLGQGATLVAALWGVFIWKEFMQAPAGTNNILILMFCSFVIGLSLVVYAGIKSAGSKEE